jgi:N-acetylmuramoyl-L-alanine amidase
MQIINHQLCQDDGTPYIFFPNKNYPPNTKVFCEYLVIHYTTGTKPEQTINWFKNPAAKASAHLLLTREGEFYQFVPFDRVGWHAGFSQWANRKSLNSYAIGIEVDNAGAMTKKNGVYMRQNRVFAPDEVIETNHKLEYSIRGWEKYPPAQMAALAEVAKLLKATYNFIDVVGHDDISLSGKTDPGPAFDMASFRDEVMGFVPGQMWVFKNCMPNQVLRKKPSDLAGSSGKLVLNKEVVVLGYERNWAQVQEVLVDGISLGALQGWMRERFLKRVRPLA